MLPRAETRQVAEWNNWLKFMLVLCFTLSKDHVIPIPTAVPILIAATRRKIGRFLASGSPHKYIRASKEGLFTDSSGKQPRKVREAGASGLLT